MTQGINLADVRKKQQEIKANAGKGGYWSPAKGSNKCRLASWASPVTDKVEFYREVDIHQPGGKGTQVYICGRSPARDGRRSDQCEWCSRYNAVKDAEGPEAAKDLRVRKRYHFIVVPIEKGGQPFKQRKAMKWNAAQTPGQKIVCTVAECDEVTNVDEYFGPGGLDFKVMYDPDASFAAMYDTKALPHNKAEKLDPAGFAEVAKLDLYQDDTLEPEWFLAEARNRPPGGTQTATGGGPVTPPVPAAAPAVQGTAVAAPPAPPSKFMTPEAAKAYLNESGLAAKGWRSFADPSNDAYFVSPEGKTQYEKPVPVANESTPPPPPPPPSKGETPEGKALTPEAQMAARGMKPAQTSPQPPPQETDDGGDGD